MMNLGLYTSLRILGWKEGGDLGLGSNGVNFGINMGGRDVYEDVICVAV